MNRKIRRQCFAILIIISGLLIFNIGNICANTESDDTFADMIRTFAENGIIPGTDGNYLSLGNYEDSFANMGYSGMTPLLEADHFVISASLEWVSAIKTPNSATNGCGLFFGADDKTGNHLMVSVRGDGNLYFSGHRKYTVLSYGKIPFNQPSYTGSAELCLIVDGSDVTVYLNGEHFLDRKELPVSGNVVGLAVLSGTFQNYGTKCSFENINIYTWE